LLGQTVDLPSRRVADRHCCHRRCAPTARVAEQGPQPELLMERAPAGMRRGAGVPGLALCQVTRSASRSRTIAWDTPPAWRNWQRTRLVIERFPVRVRAS